jgi:cyclic pyranopterin phosphate synthase
VRDRFGRPLESVRLSVLDRCNLRCSYCMPEESYVWLPRGDLLRFEEIARVVDAFGALGVARLRITGGEPLLRRDLDGLVRQLASKPFLRDLALTTNGLLLREHAAALRAAGLGRITVSLDTLRPTVFRAITGRDGLADVLAGIDGALAAGFGPLKLDTVVLRGKNDDELGELLAFARERGAELRFIEYMDVGGATGWSAADVVSAREMLASLARAFGPIEPADEARGSQTAERFRLPDGTVFGVIASTTEPFCSACDRARVTADGNFYTCLYGRTPTDLRGPLRDGATVDELAGLIASAWGARADRGAEERLALAERGPLVPASALRREPHLEMHKRGG